METLDRALYFPFSIFNLSTTTVVIDSLKITFRCDATVFVGISLTGSNAIFFLAEKRQRLFSLLISILQNRWLLPRRLLCKL